MKRLFSFLAVIAAMVLMTACDKTLNPETPAQDSSQEFWWHYFCGSVYVGDILSYESEMQEAIKELFPLSTDMARAQVVFVGESEIKAKSPSLLKAIANDAFIVFPHYEGMDEDFAQIGVDLNYASIESDEYYPLLHCYNGYAQGFTYTLWAGEDSDPEEFESTWSQADWDALMEANKAYGDEAEEELQDYILSYYESCLVSFIEWLEGAVAEQVQTKADFVTDVKGNLEQLGQRCPNTIEFGLKKQIDKGLIYSPDMLEGTGSVDVDFRVFPVYKQSSNGNNAGDYYIVVSKITPHSKNMWHPENHIHGWARNRVYGYWFNGMDVVTRLVNKDGSSISDMDYFERPIPENKNQSRQYSEGKSFNIGGSINGGGGGAPGMGGFGQGDGGLTIGAEWSSSTNYELSTIEFSMNASSPSTVEYNYSTTKNVKMTDYWGDDNKINENFPKTVRSEFNANTSWAWHVGSAKDYDTQTYVLKTKIDISYAAWHHWRGAVEYDSNKKTFNIDVPEFSWVLEAPNRVPWGIVALKNASTYEMAHIVVYDSSGKAVDAPTYSRSKDEVAKFSLPVGTYSIHFDLIDGTTQQKYGSYVYKDIKVHQGKDEKSATVSISTLDADELRS